jgi:hypothetical protein
MVEIIWPNWLLPTQSSNRSPKLESGTEFSAAETARRIGLIRLDCRSRDRASLADMPLRLRRYCECLIRLTTSECWWWRQKGSNWLPASQSSNRSPCLSQERRNTGKNRLGIS